MIKHCLFPVAGFGTRFLPVTKTVPKELLPILDKPLIQYAIDEAYESGATELVLVINEFKLAIKSYFEPFAYLDSLILNTPKKSKLECIDKIVQNCNLSFVNQSEMMGLGHAISQGKKSIGNNPFAVVLPDDLCYNDNLSVMQQMQEVYLKNQEKCIVAVEEVDINEVSKYGVIRGRPSSSNKRIYYVDDMIEKPTIKEAPSNLAIIGRYILTPEIFEVLEKTFPNKNGEIQITNALRVLAKQGKVIAFKFDGKRIDCGSVKGYIEGNVFFSNLG